MLIFALVIAFSGVLVLTWLIGLHRIEESSKAIATDNAPIDRGIEEALSALAEGQSATEQILDNAYRGSTSSADTRTKETESRSAIISAQESARRSLESLRAMGEQSNIAAQANAETLNQTLDEVRISTIVVTIFGITISLLIGILFARRNIIQPLTNLSAAAEAFGEGQLDTKAMVHAKDEIGLLASEFNDMAGRLSQYTSTLEREVATRTTSLEQKVKELDESNELLKKREEEALSANRRLLDIDQAKSEFISIAAHQLRTPLAAIKWTLSLLIDENTDNLTPEQKSLLMKGYESNERIIGLVNEMLVVTRIESGRIQFKQTPIHLEDVADSVMLDFSGQAHVRHIKLSREKPPTSSPFVNADPDMMRNVMQNLVENAMRYTPDGGTIVLTVTHTPQEVRVAIQDSGIGIPEHQKPSIFNKFFRADNAAKFRANGSGLGLYVVKSFVEKHGGKIWFVSTEGVGTTFIFTIPITPIAPAPANAPAQGTAPSPTPASAASAPPSAPAIPSVPNTV